MRRSLAVALAFFTFTGCGSSDDDDECPDGQVRVGDRCVPDDGTTVDASVDAAPNVDAGPDAAAAVLGCTDSEATNYNPAATEDDGSCEYDYPTITFDDESLTYTLTGFGGAEDSTVVEDPTDATNQVARVVRSATAETFAGTTVSTGENFSIPELPFDEDNTRMTVRVYSPGPGIQVRVKVEDASNPTISVETEATTTMTNAFETLTFDFVNQAPGTAALNVANTYDKLSIFFNFGATGAAAGEQTYYFDDIAFIGGTTEVPMFEAITFDDETVTYTLTGFGGAEDSTVLADPTDGSNMVARVVRSATAEVFAGTTVSTGENFSVPPIPFDAENTRMTVRVYAPSAGITVRLKVEDAGDPGVSVETEAVTTTANAFETLTFEFVNQVAGTAALNLDATYNKATIFFNFGVAGATAGEQTYYFDDITFIGGTTAPAAFSTVTFDDGSVTYTLTGFGGAEDSAVVVDPSDGSNTVARVNRSATAETFAGTTVSTGANLSLPRIPFTGAATQMTVRVNAPMAGIPVRLKVEDASNPTISVETEAVTTMANAFETLTFDFANEAAGTAAINVANTYNKLSIFFNFGATGAAAGMQTYYFDDIAFVP